MRNSLGKRVPLAEVWAFSDGRQAYLRQGKGYRPLTRQGSFFMFVGPAPLDVAAAGKRATGAAVGGLVGATIVASSQDETTNLPLAYALDMRTGQAMLMGQVAPFPRPGRVPPADTAYIYIYRPAGSQAVAERVLLNDKEVGRSQPGRYLEIACPNFGHLVRLSVGAAGGASLLLVSKAAAPNYVKLLDSPTPWQWMPTREGAADVDALDRLPE